MPAEISVRWYREYNHIIEALETLQRPLADSKTFFELNFPFLNNISKLLIKDFKVTLINNSEKNFWSEKDLFTFWGRFAGHPTLDGLFVNKNWQIFSLSDTWHRQLLRNGRIRNSWVTEIKNRRLHEFCWKEGENLGERKKASANLKSMHVHLDVSYRLNDFLITLINFPLFFCLCPLVEFYYLYWNK